MKQISDLLKHASNVAAQQQKKEAERKRNGEYFNVFRLCRVDHYENLHSYILASLLNPEGNHGQGSLFLDLFLEFLDDSFSSTFNSKQAYVYTEYSTDFGRIDILIEDNTGRAIIIENKIYAQDQDSQIQRYNQFALSKYKKDGYRIIYLTLDGHEAAKHSGEGVSYTRLSYRESIIQWLNQCLESVSIIPALREPLIQYENLIKQLVGYDMDYTSDHNLLREMVESPEGVATIMRAIPEWEKVIINNCIFNPLEVYAKQSGLKFFVDPDFWSKKANTYFEFIFDEIHSIKFECQSGWYRFYYGLQDASVNHVPQKPIAGFSGVNEWWPYGSKYIDVHWCWTIYDLAEISQDKGAFCDYIIKAVNLLRDEMKKERII